MEGKSGWFDSDAFYEALDAANELAKDGINAWPARAGLNVATIKRYAPDTIGIQEMQSGNWQTYLDQLPDYDRVKGPQYANKEPFGYPSIFWKASRFQLLDSGGFWLSETPDRFSGGWDTQDIRSAAWVKLRCTDTGLVFTHWNTHLDNKGETARVQGPALLPSSQRAIRARSAASSSGSSGTLSRSAILGSGPAGRKLMR